MQLLSKFYKKYPEVKYFPMHNNVTEHFGGLVELTHPAAIFIRKQRSLINKGYTEQKAFEIVEEDLGKFINKQKEEMRVLRGVAINVFGDSYLDRMQRVAELESTLKVQRFQRDIPKFQRAQDNWITELQR